MSTDNAKVAPAPSGVGETLNEQVLRELQTIEKMEKMEISNQQASEARNKREMKGIAIILFSILTIVVVQTTVLFINANQHDDVDSGVSSLTDKLGDPVGTPVTVSQAYGICETAWFGNPRPVEIKFELPATKYVGKRLVRMAIVQSTVEMYLDERLGIARHHFFGPNNKRIRLTCYDKTVHAYGFSKDAIKISPKEPAKTDSLQLMRCPNAFCVQILVQSRKHVLPDLKEIGRSVSANVKVVKGTGTGGRRLQVAQVCTDIQDKNKEVEVKKQLENDVEDNFTEFGDMTEKEKDDLVEDVLLQLEKQCEFDLPNDLQEGVDGTVEDCLLGDQAGKFFLEDVVKKDRKIEQERIGTLREYDEIEYKCDADMTDKCCSCSQFQEENLCANKGQFDSSHEFIPVNIIDGEFTSGRNDNGECTHEQYKHYCCRQEINNSKNNNNDGGKRVRYL
eukprot:g2238.t1